MELVLLEYNWQHQKRMVLGSFITENMLLANLTNIRYSITYITVAQKPSYIASEKGF